jgi:hypothetical protein
MRTTWITVLATAALAVVGCGGTPSSSGPSSVRTVTTSTTSATSTTSSSAARAKPPAHPRVLRAALGTGATAFVPAVAIGGRTAVWIARTTGGVALLSFDQSLITLDLHSGTVDAGGSGWRFGPSISGSERRAAVAAFNGGFKFDTGAGGFMSGGRVALRLRRGLGSIVTYADGMTDIGSWRHEVPSPGHAVASVRQNLALLIDHGRAAGNVDCLDCWGATLGGVTDPARSALGVTADGRLIWAGGEHVTAAQLAGALLGARVQRAVELDINPEWVAAYLYEHRGRHGQLAPLPVVPGQPGVPGQFLAPYGRDFFVIRMR